MQSLEQTSQKKRKELYYAVKKGYKIGVFSSWDECKELTDGYPGAEFKSFTNIHDANEYMLELVMDQPIQKSVIDTNAIGEEDFVEDSFSDEQNIAYNKYLQGENVFISGPGGSGKTRLIQWIYKHARSRNKRIQVCALTGCAAILLNCSAKTIHSWAGIGLATEPNEKIVDKIARSKYKRKLWNSIDILVIDEVSMMSMKIFNLLNDIGKKVRKNTTSSFGGIQLIFSGDFYQLPPVGNIDDESTCKFCFESALWNSTFSETVELKKIFRQNDELYIKILNEIRIGKLHRSSFNALKERVGVMPTDITTTPTILLPRRHDVDEINTTKLSNIEDDIVEYTVRKADNITLSETETNTARGFSNEDKEKECKYLMKNILCDETIQLKKGAQVMCVANLDTESVNGICNGSQGIIEDFVHGYPLVHFNNGSKRIIKRHVWKSENIPDVGIEHIPLILSWAITIHKAQGVTLENALIDVGTGIFEFGQSYVALSRVKSLEGLYLKNFNPQKIKIHPKVKEFYKD